MECCPFVKWLPIEMLQLGRQCPILCADSKQAALICVRTRSQRTAPEWSQPLGGMGHSLSA
jgi:hypothetical protein